MERRGSILNISPRRARRAVCWNGSHGRTHNKLQSDLYMDRSNRRDLVRTICQRTERQDFRPMVSSLGDLYGRNLLRSKRNILRRRQP